MAFLKLHNIKLGIISRLVDVRPCLHQRPDHLHVSGARGAPQRPRALDQIAAEAHGACLAEV